MVFGAWYGYGYWHYATTHVSTDDAFLTNDVVEISPEVSGSIKAVLVQENQTVKAGQVIALIDDAPYRAAVDQAKANLEAAIAQGEGAGVAVQLTAATGGAMIQQAGGVVDQAGSGIESAKADLLRSKAGVASAQATAASAEAGVLTAKAALDGAKVAKARAADAYASLQAVVRAAKATVGSAQAGVDAADAGRDKAEADSVRGEKLFSEGAISRQAIDGVRAAVKAARAQSESARRQQAAAEAAVGEHEAEMRAAKREIAQAEAGVQQARAQVEAAEKMADSAKAGIASAHALDDSAREGVAAALGKRVQALGQLRQANTAPIQVGASKTERKAALAKIDQARAALRTAEIQLGYTRIVAPSDGRVSKKSIEVGSLVEPGSPLFAFVPAKDVWVVANFKETQLANVYEGQEAEIEVDGFPGREFRAHVDSLSAATGSTFALLPPDNATGNFTKVVQRIPVRIALEKGLQGLDRLRAGMSVTAIIVTGK